MDLPIKIKEYIWNNDVMKSIGSNATERIIWLESNPQVKQELLHSEKIIMETIIRERERIKNGIIWYKANLLNVSEDFAKRKRIE